MVNKITKISDTEIEIEEPVEKYRLTKKEVLKRLAQYQSVVAEYEEMLKKFN